MKIPVYKITIPNYGRRGAPDDKFIGAKIDEVLKKYFLGQRLAIRCLSSAEHRGKTADGLIELIKKTGTDRYNPKRSGLKYKNIGDKKIEFFALDRTVTKRAKIMWQFIWSFYHYPKQWGIKPTKVDLVILYDRKQLKSVRYTEDGGRYKSDGFVFKNAQNRTKTLKGLVKIL